MEEYFEQVLKQQQQVNDHLIEFSDYLNQLLEEKDEQVFTNNETKKRLANIFGLKHSLVKPSFLFSNTPDINQFPQFRSYYVDKALNRQITFSASFSKDEKNKIDNSFIEKLQLLFGEDHLDELTDLKTLYHIKQLIAKYQRKHQLYCFDDLNIKREQNCHHPNRPLADENVHVHRVIVTSELFLPYEITTELTNQTALRSFQIILHGNSKIFKKKLSTLPILKELYSSIVEQSGLNFSTLRNEIFPQPINNSSLYEISMEQVEWLSTKYLSNIFRHRVDWENSLTKRSEIIYKFLSYFTTRLDQRKDASSVFCSQYPVMVKRNGEYMLIYGIRWKPFTNINNTINLLRKKGLYGLEFNSEHFNNFPYFFGDGRECIPTERPHISSTLLRNFKEQLKIQIIERSGTKGYTFPKYPPFRYWIFDHFFNQSVLSKNEFLAVMEGRRSLFEIILKHRPDMVLENEINNTLITSLEESLQLSKKIYSSKIKIGDLKSIEVPKFSKYYSVFLPFYLHIDGCEIGRTDHLFSINFEEYIKFIVYVLCELTGFHIEISHISLLDLLIMRESIQENMFEKKINFNNSLFYVCENLKTSRGHCIIDIIPNLMETIRSNMKFLRLDDLYFKLYLRGLYIPENPILHRDFIQQKIKTFLTKLKNHEMSIKGLNQEETKLMKDNLTLIARFLDLKWKRPLSYIQVMTPATRVVISKLVKTYSLPLEHALKYDSAKQYLNRMMFIPFQSKTSNFSLQLLEAYHQHSNKEDDLLEIVNSFIGKYRHDIQKSERQLSLRLLFLFLTECFLRQVIVNESSLPKLALLFKNNVNDATRSFPNFDCIEREILDLKNTQQLERREISKLNISHLNPFIFSSTLVWRSDFHDLSKLKLLILNSLEKAKFLILPISVIIAKFEKENCFIWNNVLEQSFELLTLENLKHNITSFFPIQYSKTEEEEWSNHYKKLLKLGTDYLEYYPFKILNSKSVPSISKIFSHQLEEKIDIIDMFFKTIDTFMPSSRLVLENSINSLSLKSKGSANQYHRQFGFLYSDLCYENMKKSKEFIDDWGLTLNIKCMSRRILRKLKQATLKKEILGRTETNFNISSDGSTEILQLAKSIIESLGKHTKNNKELENKLKNITGYNTEKQKFSALQESIQEVLEFCNDYERLRLTQEMIFDESKQVLSPREQSSFCSSEIVRNSITNHELFSIVPFIDRVLTRSKTKEIILNTIPRYNNEDDHMFQYERKPLEVSPFMHYLENQIQNITQNSFENSMSEKIIDYSYMLAYGKAKLLYPNWYDECFNSVFITEAEASYMNEKDRPLFYKSSDLEWEILNKDFPSHAICENVETLEKLALEGVDGRLVLGGFCGGDCDLLLFHPDCEELKNGGLEMSDLKKSLAKQRLEYFGEVGCGWMNFDEIVGPGIELSGATSGDTTRENIWVSNELCTFNYNPNKTLEQNKLDKKDQHRSNKGLKYITHPKRFDQLDCGHHHLRDTIPLYDLKFLFYSATPFSFKEFCDNK